MKYFAILILLLSTNCLLSSQKITWVMGYQNGINDTNEICGKFELKFNNTDEPQAFCTYNNSILNMLNNQETICDSSGQLLFYFDGYRIADKNHEIIENGEGINSGTVRELYPKGYPSLRGSLILPDPIDKNKWYIFHQYLEYLKNQPSGNGIFCTNVYYTVIILDTISNRLKVLSKNSPLLINTNSRLVNGHFNAVKHANGKDWWIITQELESNKFFLFRLTGEGIVPRMSITSGLIPSNRDYNSTSVFSKDGSKFVTCFAQDFIQIFDFDRCAGKLTNSKRIYNEEIHVLSRGFVEISADNHFLYASTLNKIWQYDLWSANIQLSEKLVGIWDTIYYKGLSTSFYTMTRAIDDKIYISCNSSNLLLHRINNPNRSGDSCDFKIRAIVLPEYYVDLPQSTNYFLGRLNNSNCDSINTIHTNDILNILVYPVPAQDYLEFDNINQISNLKILICNTNGVVLIKSTLVNEDNSNRIDISSLENGTYFYQISNINHNVLNGKFIVLR
ncbi:MAG: T9SS type A sorting domain-containing protein [Saprospiraceae bacterium]